MSELCICSDQEPRLIRDIPPAAQGPVQMSTGRHDSVTCSCFNFSRNKKMPIAVRSQQGKKSRDFWPRNSICHPSGSSLAWLPLAISERGSGITLSFEPLKLYASVRDECYHTLSKPKHTSTSTPHKFFISLQS